MYSNLNLYGMPGNCGMRIVCYFGWDDPRAKKPLKRDLANALNKILGSCHSGVIIATLNENQANSPDNDGESGVPEEVLLEAGFVLVSEGYKKSTGKMLYVYVKECEKPKN